jgi:L-ascorbate metabolism protein UlaG (beta-lactamase superfamily)
MLIEVEGWRLLLDPTFDPPGRRYRFGWGTSSRKTTGPAIQPGDIGPIDAVLLTHDHHADNLDDAGRALLPNVDHVLTTVSGAKRLNGNAQGLAPWQTTHITAPARPTIEVTATPCRHGPPGSHPIVGDVVGFALRWEGQRNGALWSTGDTVFYDELRKVPEHLDVGIALMHLGGVRFPISGPLRYTMTGSDAVELCSIVRPNVAIPIHYEGWSHFRDGRQSVQRALDAADARLRDRFRWLPIGQRTQLDA